jgi:hypothetical protein
MQVRTLALSLAVAAAALASVVSMAGPMAGHPNIIAAREDASHAIAKLKAAQKANEYDLGGHAKKAEDLLNEAVEEMKLAAAADDKKDKH